MKHSSLLAVLLALCFGLAAVSPQAANGRYSVVGGRITDPAGAIFTPRGINLSSAQLACCTTYAKTLFKGANFVRVAFHSYLSPTQIAPYVNSLTNSGVVVELEDHTSIGRIYKGARLTTELNWFRSLAIAFKNNPRVWFGTLNEPDIDWYNNPPRYSFDDMIAQERAIYDSIRGAGNPNPILMQLRGGWYAWPSTQYTSVFRGMKNIVWDIHYYGWQSKFSTDQSVVNQTLLAASGDNYGGVNVIRNLLRSGDGVVPVIVGEYGVSTFATACDANYRQVVEAVQQASTYRGVGAVAWAYDSTFNSLAISNIRTRYGAEVDAWLRTGVINSFNPCQ